MARKPRAAASEDAPPETAAPRPPRRPRKATSDTPATESARAPHAAEADGTSAREARPATARKPRPKKVVAGTKAVVAAKGTPAPNAPATDGPRPNRATRRAALQPATVANDASASGPAPPNRAGRRAALKPVTTADEPAPPNRAARRAAARASGGLVNATPAPAPEPKPARERPAVEAAPSAKDRRPRPPKDKTPKDTSVKALRPDLLPSKAEILAFIASHPGSGKREVARHFGIGGGAKVALKRLLKELAEEGEVEKKHRKLVRSGDLPPVLVLSVVERDRDGDLVAQPAEWDETTGDAPRIFVAAQKQPRNARIRVPAPAVGDRVLARISGSPGSYTARVMKVLERRPESMLGIVRHTGAEWRLEPISKKEREAVLDPQTLAGAKDGDLVRAALTRTGPRLHPRVEVVEIVGSMTGEKAVSMLAIHAHAIPHVFPAAVLAEAEEAPVRISRKDREDWRDLPLVTIDPPDAKDHDDAVHAAPDDDASNPGGFVCTVAIADVGLYVRPGTALDHEARLRGNSVYFPDRVVPMLPERISNDLCSLREGLDRPALAVRMVFDAEGRKRTHSFHRILMRSAAKLSYAAAQAAFDAGADPVGDDLGAPVLRPLWAAYQVLARGRAAREPLALELPERKVLVGPDGQIERIMTAVTLEANRLIEEFMIQANVAAAETLEKQKSPLVYRIHDAPSLAKLESLREFLGSIEVSLPKQGNLRPSHFNQILTRLKETEHGRIIHEVVLRSQSQAEYSPANIGHFGLNLRRYAHFTSPIRRYADLIVHRGLIRALGLGDGALPDGIEAELPEISAEISATERRAMAAERETIDRLVAYWLADRIGATFTGRIAGVTRSGLFVKLDETGADGFIPIGTIGADYYVHDEGRHALVGRNSGETHRLGDQVEVKLVEVAPVAGALRFQLLSEGSVGKSRPRPGGRPDKGFRGFKGNRPGPRGSKGGRRR
ncbi:MAG: ribonuclease R [Bauldia sp.]|nr:ribonuclease R [Bauldia sp.]